MDSKNRKLSPLGVVVKKCARELQAEPPLSERRSQLILQSLLNILNNHSMETTSNTLHNGTDSSHSAANTAKAIAVDNGALPAITAVMKIYKDSAKLQSRAILIFAALAQDNADHQDAIADCHGVSYILAAMLAHSKSSSLCLEACSALVKCTSLCPRSASQLAHGDGVRTLRDTMQLHSKHPGIQQYALQVLVHVSRQPPPPTNLLNQNHTHDPYVCLHFVEDPELMELLVELLIKHRKVKPILQLGGTLIHILAKHGKPRTKSSLVWSKAVPVLLKVSKSFSSNALTQLDALQALLALSIERPEAREVVAEDGSTIIFDAMSCHARNLAIQHTATQLIHLFCQGHTSIFIAKCLKKHSKYVQVLQNTRDTFPIQCATMIDQILAC